MQVFLKRDGFFALQCIVDIAIKKKNRKLHRLQYSACKSSHGLEGLMPCVEHRYGMGRIWTLLILAHDPAFTIRQDPLLSSLVR